MHVIEIVSYTINELNHIVFGLSYYALSKIMRHIDLHILVRHWVHVHSHAISIQMRSYFAIYFIQNHIFSKHDWNLIYILVLLFIYLTTENCHELIVYSVMFFLMDNFQNVINRIHVITLIELYSKLMENELHVLA